MQDINATLRALQKKYGDSVVMRLTDNIVVPIEAVSTGVLALDLAMGVGGFPVGRLIELYGPPMSGKTSLAIFHLVEQQKKFPDKYVSLIDMEHAFDPELAVKYGLDLETLLVSQPGTAEEAFDIAETLIRSDAVSCIALDSVSSLLPKVEDEAEIGKQTIGLQARLMSQACRKLAPILDKHRTTMIFINQIRKDIASYGAPNITSGGKALPFYASVRVEVRSGEPINSKGLRIGHKVMCKVVKNKVAPPFRTCTFDLIYGIGVDRVAEVVDLSLRAHLVSQSGAWISCTFNGEEIKAQGKDKFVAVVRDNSGLYSYLEGLVRGNRDEVLVASADDAVDE